MLPMACCHPGDHEGKEAAVRGGGEGAPWREELEEISLDISLKHLIARNLENEEKQGGVGEVKQELPPHPVLPLHHGASWS